MCNVVLLHFGVLVAALVCGSLGVRAETCAEFPARQDVIKLAASGTSACFWSEISPGAASRFTVLQPVDMILTVRANGVPLRIDGFEFGTETVTLSDAGKFNIQISAKTGSLPRYVTVSRTAVSLQDAAKFQQAENGATATKENQTESGLQNSLQLWQGLGDGSAVARTRLKLGEYWNRLENYDQARQEFEAAADLCGEFQDLRCRTEALNNSGLESQRLADFDAARSRLEEAARGWKSIGDRYQAGITLSNLGLLYSTVHECRAALSFDQQAAEAIGRANRAEFARVMINFGLCYQALAEYEKARNYFLQALRIGSAIKGGERDFIRAEINLGRTLLSMGRIQPAIMWLSRAKAAAAKQGYRTVLADASTNLGQAFLAEGSTARAAPLLQSALEVHRAFKDKRFAASDEHFLGVVAAREGRTEEAKRCFLEAAKIRTENNLTVQASDSYYQLALLEFQAGHLDAAHDWAVKFLALTEKVREDLPGPALRGSFSSTQRKLFDLAISIEVCRRGPDSLKASFLTAEKGQGRAILDLLAESALLSKPPEHLQKRKLFLEHQIGLISSAILEVPEGRSAEMRERASMLIAERENLNAEIEVLQPERRLGRPLDSVERLQQQILSPNTALLQFHLGEPESFAWFVTAGSLELIHLPNRKTIDRHAKEYCLLFARVTERKKSTELQKQFLQAAERLSRDLLAGLRGKKLPETLILVCDGILHRVPFEALTIGGKGAMLGLSLNIVRVPSAGYLEAGREVRPLAEFPKTFLGVFDPVYAKADMRLGSAASPRVSGPELARLPFSFELASVDRLVTRSKRLTLRGFDANIRRFEASEPGRYAILHFSTHAIVDDAEPDLSRVVLSLVDQRGRKIDGYLHPAQFARLRLNGSVVVLSACDTALGKDTMGEGLWGLTTSLLEGGASQLVLTLSPVDAEASSEFFGQVYRDLLGRNPIGMECAVTRARRALATKPRWADPYYWASFVVVGRPSGRG